MGWALIDSEKFHIGDGKNPKTPRNRHQDIEF